MGQPSWSILLNIILLVVLIYIVYRFVNFVEVFTDIASSIGGIVNLIEEYIAALIFNLPNLENIKEKIIDLILELSDKYSNIVLEWFELLESYFKDNSSYENGVFLEHLMYKSEALKEASNVDFGKITNNLVKYRDALKKEEFRDALLLKENIHAIINSK